MFVLFFQLYVIGGMGEGQELNDVKVLKLINPSERKPSKKYGHILFFILIRIRKTIEHVFVLQQHT